MKKNNINKKRLIIVIAIIVAIIAAIIILTKVLNKEEVNNKPEVNNKLEIGNFESDIDMTNTENSEIRDDGMKINNSSKIAQGIKFNSVLIKDIRIESTGDMATFDASVENDLGKDLKGYIIYLIFLDKDGNTIDRVETFFPDIPKGETGYITATTPKDIATAYDIKIERDMR